MIDYQFFPRSLDITPEIKAVIDCFSSAEPKISSAKNKLSSNKVLEHLFNPLTNCGFKVEAGKNKNDKIHVPVLFGTNNHIDKSFHADAVSLDGKIVIEVEAGRAVVNNQFMKDIFQACMMFGVEYLVIAVRKDYRGVDDFQKVYTFLETLYISNRLRLPLKGILIVGY
jgi:hypothetical protein